MMSDLRIITVAGDPEREARLAAALAHESGFELYMRCVERSELLACLRTGTVDAVLVVGVATWVDIQCIDEAAERSVRVVCIPCDPLDVEVMAYPSVEVLEVGAGNDDVLRLLLRDSKPVAPSREVGSGRLLAVWGPKGSPGRSTIAIELASEFSFREPRTLLLDADEYGGDLKQMLGVVEEIPTTVWAARLAGRGVLGELEIARELRRTSAVGPVLLPGLPRSELWMEVPDYGWNRLLERLRGLFSVIVADLGFCLEADLSMRHAGEGRNAMSRICLASADRIVAVFKADPVGLKNFIWSFAHLEELADVDKVKVVANQVRPGHENEIRDIVRQNLGVELGALIPYSPGEVAYSLSLGRSVKETKPGSGLSRAVRDLAATLGASVERSGLLTRLAGRA